VNKSCVGKLSISAVSCYIYVVNTDGNAFIVYMNDILL
jgi:hypothetical protein